MRGGGFQYSNTAIETALMMEGTFSMPSPALQGFFELAFKPMDVTLISVNVQRQFTPNIAIKREGYSIFRY
ncbi:hypothetical protein BGI33_09535 [Snodgrassella alvi]|uniref:Uncharacterized protein n=1 Tax=Snodgrassella alvi TaxID=1196083 RepID=A0A2N9WT23_9NEIS|nr:hypothetical protein BGI33_09535 [Snodgrassella alvi]PIT14407.1 hypothetical protein BGI32_07570 [Snodgrassella alvi]PIT19095.1 hypothetical protein BGI34_03700 [Snodgrassella alvi]PIT20105.1 hypothetical protein BGI34_02275 [Snodgrassella alvi]